MAGFKILFHNYLNILYFVDKGEANILGIRRIITLQTHYFVKDIFILYRTCIFVRRKITFLYMEHAIAAPCHVARISSKTDRKYLTKFRHICQFFAIW